MLSLTLQKLVLLHQNDCVIQFFVCFHGSFAVIVVNIKISVVIFNVGVPQSRLKTFPNLFLISCVTILFVLFAQQNIQLNSTSIIPYICNIFIHSNQTHFKVQQISSKNFRLYGIPFQCSNYLYPFYFQYDL